MPLLWCMVALMFGSLSSTSTKAEQQRSAPSCRPDGPVATIPELPEASGIAVSRRVPGRLWAHNDSGQPILFALDARGAVTGRLRLSGAEVEDWEAVAVGPCPTGSCIYVADIGDNDARRQRITIYRVPEPAGAETSAAVKDAFHATYPDGAHDAEALLITPAGDLLIVTKGDTGAVAMYRFPRELKPGATHQLERIGKPRGSGKPGGGERITDGAVSADGQWVVLRTGQSLTFHRTAELMAGNWSEVRRVDLKAVGETQGEAVALGANDTVFLAGEGGGKSQPGTFARFTCTANP
jgi:hypothetical protein